VTSTRRFWIWTWALALWVASTSILAACRADFPQPSSPALGESQPQLSADDQAAVRFRRQFALPSSLDHIRRVESDPTANRDYGVPLLPGEMAEIEGRSQAAEGAIALIEEYGSRNPDAYGGVYLDHPSGGKIVALFTGGLDQHVAGVWDAVWPTMPSLPIRFRPVPHSERELIALQDRIGRDTEALADLGVSIRFVLVDIERNQLEVGVDSSLSPAERAFVARYGPGWIRVTPASG
jgi:hypothetical protein